MSSSSYFLQKLDGVPDKKPSENIKRYLSSDDSDKNSKLELSNANSVFCGVPRQLFPLYCSFVFDAISVGLVMPLLPFFAMELGANAFQLSLVASTNYFAQMIGALVMGQVSDNFGRRVAVVIFLLASSVQYIFVSYSKTLVQLTMARAISGILGGFVPIIQTSVADVASETDRPKYLGRVTASFGLGFILGPLISAAVSGLSIRQKIRLASLFPFLGWIVSFLFFRETNANVLNRRVKKSTSSASIGNSPMQIRLKPSPSGTNLYSKFCMSSPNTTNMSPVSLNIDVEKNSVATSPSGLRIEVLLLILNGFLLMYAFSTETVYAMFIKDSFGLGEKALSMLFALNGIMIGIFQVFLIKPLVNKIGKYATLGVGNLVLAIGMIGIALIREKSIHFSIFVIHVVGFSIADTALVSLVTQYSPPENQGRALAFNHAASACARVISPLLAGLIYEFSKDFKAGNAIGLPVGALPFLLGAMFPAFG